MSATRTGVVEKVGWMTKQKHHKQIARENNQSRPGLSELSSPLELLQLEPPLIHAPLSVSLTVFRPFFVRMPMNNCETRRIYPYRISSCNNSELQCSTKAIDLIPRYLSGQPPSRIDPYNLDYASRKAAEAFRQTAVDLLHYHLVDATIGALTRNWSRVWPWIKVYSKGVLDTPSSAASKNATIIAFLESLPLLLTYPARSPHCTNPHDVLEPILKSTPEILAVATEMWLYSHEAGLADTEIAELLSNVSDILLKTHTQHDKALLIHVKGEVWVELERVLNQPRWDIPHFLVTQIVRFAGMPRIDCVGLGSVLCFMNALSNSASDSTMFRLGSFLAKDGIRWLCKIYARLSSPTYSRPVPTNTQFDHVAVCLLQCLAFICHAAHWNAYSLIPALDGGLLVSMFKAQDLLLEDIRRRGTTYHSVIVGCVVILNLTATCLVHRPILVRVLQSIRKVQALDLDSDDHMDRFAGHNERFRILWSTIKQEAQRRQECAMVPLDVFGVLACGHSECANNDVGSDFMHPRLLRCAGCKSNVYCSKICQKAAWGTHKGTCIKLRAMIKSGRLIRGFVSRFESLFLRYQVIEDYLSNPKKVKEACEQYGADNPGDDLSNRQVAIRMEYSTQPVGFIVDSAEDARKRVETHAKEGCPIVGTEETLGGDLAAIIASVPFAAGPIIIYI
ncbi:hypothetical protein PQX77_018026 [Marasmius sp. AFHP31]|nr:hypothetical protein PQX77_018026 [Marasmius sp. AFHP31]